MEIDDTGKRKLSEKDLEEFRAVYKQIEDEWNEKSEIEKNKGLVGILKPENSLAVLGLAGILKPENSSAVLGFKQIEEAKKCFMTENAKEFLEKTNILLREDPKLKADREFKKELFTEIQRMLKEFKEELLIEIQRMLK
jgi:hypothetical protein